MSRRWRYPRSRRGAFWPVVPPSVAAPATPAFVPSRAARVRRLLAVRRGRFAAVPPAQVVAAPSAVPRYVQPDRRVGLLVRRGRFFSLPPAPVVVPVAAVPTFARALRRPVAAVRRGRYWTVPLAPLAAPGAVTAPPAWISRRTVRTYLLPRGSFQPVPPAASVVPQTQALPPTWQARRVQRTYLLPRGSFQPVPPAAPAPATPAVPPWIRQTCRTRALPVRRGHVYGVPATPIVAAPPREQRRPHTVRYALARRGKFFPVPPAPSGPGWTPAFRVTRRRPVLAARRGHTHALRLAGVTIVIPPYTAPEHWTAVTVAPVILVAGRRTGTATTRPYRYTATTREP